MKEPYTLSNTTADIVVDKLIAWDVDTIFSLVGDAVNPIFEALRRRKADIRLIGVRHEEAAAFMASGYAKITGKLGVCLAISGPGTTHLLNGLYDAAMEGAPVLAITGVITQDFSGGTYSQEIDAISLLDDVADFNERVTGPVHAQSMVDIACRTSLTNGTVSHLSIPTEIQQMALKDDVRLKKQGHLTGSSFHTPGVETPPNEALEQAAKMLNKSSKVMILAGRGALAARDEVLELARLLGAPVAKALLAKALLPDDSPYTTGGIGTLGTLPSKKMMEACDLLLILGSTMPYLEYYPTNAKAIQIDLDPSRIGLRYPVQIGLTGDVKATLSALIPKLNKKTNRHFIEKAQEEMGEWRAMLRRMESIPSKLITPPYLVAKVAQLLEDDAHIAIDTGAHTVFTARHLPIKDQQEITVCGNLASAGPALSYGIAAQLANPERQCVVMAGDGGFSMLMVELATAVHYDLPLKIIIFKNNSFAIEGYEQEEAGAEKYGVELHPINFKKFAEACGAEGYSCSDPAKLQGVLNQAFQSEKTSLIEVEIDADYPPEPPEVMNH
ncbi:hypothetical protein KUV50_08730 [Membranicola marinus]|uniref:Pyruvate oxidase n=1 Tax=Membranihabitans marinus TaxID=1227546 RepID=A0A953L701_9BACT|nr:thiamine pyrophosphate-dependent enzyme [Membranihabitans marinus]MBY5958212.1 hypothetical protein [Membranihabitans marinus]